MRVPKRKAEAMPETERPEIRIGEPTMKIKVLLRSADCQVGGDVWISFITVFDTELWAIIFLEALLAGLGFGFGFGWRIRVRLVLRREREWWNWNGDGETEMDFA